VETCRRTWVFVEWVRDERRSRTAFFSMDLIVLSDTRTKCIMPMALKRNISCVLLHARNDEVQVCFRRHAVQKLPQSWNPSRFAGWAAGFLKLVTGTCFQDSDFDAIAYRPDGISHSIGDRADKRSGQFITTASNRQFVYNSNQL
jgi:hypothetical protein